MEALLFLLVLFGVISALVAAERKRRNLLSPIAKGRHGEQSLRAALSTLPGAPTFFPNLYLPTATGRTVEIDLVMVHESGIYVFESKNYSGWIFGSSWHRTWTQTLPARGSVRKTHFFNPCLQNASHIQHLRRVLHRQTLPFYSYIVFADACTLKDITVPGNHTVLYLSETRRAVREQMRAAGHVLTHDEIERINQRLASFASADPATHAKHIRQILVDSTPYAPKICPRCGAKLYLRTIKQGPRAGTSFWGCSRYPYCPFTEPCRPSDISDCPTA